MNIVFYVLLGVVGFLVFYFLSIFFISIGEFFIKRKNKFIEILEKDNTIKSKKEDEGDV